MTARPHLAALAAAAVGVQVGSAIVATRFVAGELGPLSLSLLRYAVGTACLVPAVLAARRVPIARADLAPIALLGIVQFGGVVSLLNVGLASVPAAPAALLFATFPLLAMLLAALLGRERLTLAKSAGVALTLAGVAWTVRDGLATGEVAGGGALAILAAAGCGALCAVLYRPYLARYPALGIGALAMAASVAALVPAALPEGLLAALPRVSGGGWLAVLFIGVSSGVGYWLWLWALAHASATRVTVFLGLSPPTAALLGPLVLGEAPSSALLVGLAAVVAGIWLAHRPERPARDQSPGVQAL